MSKPAAVASYGELAALAVVQAGVIESLRVEVAQLRTEVASLRRQVGRDSSNSSQPPSTDDLGATAKAKADKRSREQTAARHAQAGAGRPARTSGQRPGAGGSPGPDRQVEPGECGCGGSGRRTGRVASSVQVFDLPALALTVTEYLMMARACGVRSGHDRGPAGWGAWWPDLLRPARDGRRDLAGLPGRDRGGAGRGHDVRAAGRAGLDRVRVVLPDPPGRRLDRGRLRGDAESGTVRKPKCWAPTRRPPR